MQDDIKRLSAEILCQIVLCLGQTSFGNFLPDPNELRRNQFSLGSREKANLTNDFSPERVIFLGISGGTRGSFAKRQAILDHTGAVSSTLLTDYRNGSEKSEIHLLVAHRRGDCSKTGSVRLRGQLGELPLHFFGSRKCTTS
jgi:hypothetical protein